MKRLASILLSLAIVLTSAVPTFAYGADFAEELRSAGFSQPYINRLVELHAKYPNWIFEPLYTGLDWADAVNGERTPHSDQLIQKSSLYDNSMYCSCSSCYRNNNYVVQEAGNWVSASQKAVEYYMNPVNWLDENYIFQFESTSYDGTQTKEGVESILYGTWMYDSLITYQNTLGQTVLFDSVTKYSDAIMAAASSFGISAYYLAAKIRQENGGSTASATAVNGGSSPFWGIYNYFNIGAYTGALDGLAWANGFLKTNKATTMYSNYDLVNNIVYGTTSSIPSNTYLTYIGTYGNYYYVRLYTEANGRYTEGASGFISTTDIRTTYIGDTNSGYGRPWTDPYKAIFYGAKYIANSFGTQNTGYLQKFNVSPQATSRFTNEYMKNVAGASAEALSTYNGYSAANILGITKRFIIPVYTNMPDSLDINNLAVTSFDTGTVTLDWDDVEGANGYQVEMKVNNQWSLIADVSDSSICIGQLLSCNDYEFRVFAYKVNGDSYEFGMSSESIVASTTPLPMVKPKATSTSSSVTLSWPAQNAATGYAAYLYNSKTKKYEVYSSVSKGATKITLKGLKHNKSYKFAIAAYKKISDKNYYGGLSAPVTIKTKNRQVTISKITSPKSKTIKIKWGKEPGVTGYQVMWSTDKKFAKNYLTSKVNGQAKNSKTINTSKSKKKYYVRVRAYKVSKGKTKYYPWSKAKSIKVK